MVSARRAWTRFAVLIAAMTVLGAGLRWGIVQVLQFEIPLSTAMLLVGFPIVVVFAVRKMRSWG